MRRSTTVFLLLLAITAGVYYYLKNREKPVETPEIAFTFEPAAEVEFLFPAELGEPLGIRVESKAGEVVELTRNADNVWTLVQPLEVAAEQIGAAAATSQIATVRIVDRLDNVAPTDVGLDAPEYTLTVTFKDEVKRIIHIGVVTPSETGYYALVDEKVVVVSKPAFDALIGLIANPPYAETLTPSPTGTETPLPATETLTPTPEPSATLTPEPATPTP